MAESPGVGCRRHPGEALNTMAIPSVITSIDKKFLRIKCPSNHTSEAELLRVVYFLREIIKFSDVIQYEFENGKQNQKHIHCVIKKLKMPTPDELGKMSATFKKKKLKYFEESIMPNETLDGYKTILIEKEIDLKKYNWHLSNIEDDAHLKTLSTYLQKEKNIIQFID